MIGTNKKDSRDTVDTWSPTWPGASLREVSADYADELVRWLLDRQPALVTDDHWQLIDAHERSAGEPHGRPRGEAGQRGRTAADRARLSGRQGLSPSVQSDTPPAACRG